MKNIFFPNKQLSPNLKKCDMNVAGKKDTEKIIFIFLSVFFYLYSASSLFENRN